MEEQMENIFTDEARAAEHLASGVHSELYEHAYAGTNLTFKTKANL
jgi:hypothetical protein